LLRLAMVVCVNCFESLLDLGDEAEIAIGANGSLSSTKSSSASSEGMSCSSRSSLALTSSRNSSSSGGLSSAFALPGLGFFAPGIRGPRSRHSLQTIVLRSPTKRRELHKSTATLQAYWRLSVRVVAYGSVRAMRHRGDNYHRSFTRSTTQSGLSDKRTPTPSPKRGSALALLYAVVVRQRQVSQLGVLRKLEAVLPARLTERQYQGLLVAQLSSLWQ